MGDWISVEDRLPDEGKAVLCMTTITNHFMGGELQNIKIAALRKGLSIKEREKMKANGDERWRIQTGNDEGVGNNMRPYSWSGFGASDYFGQEVTHWMPLPNPPHNQ